MVFADGTVTWAPGFKWKTSCPVDLKYFPYDIQKCNVMFINWMYNGMAINFTKAGLSTVLLNNYVPNGEWELLNTYVDDTPNRVEDIEGVVEMPQIQFTLELKRLPAFFENAVIVPCIIMTLMTAMVFVLPSESGEKVSLGTTLMLSYTVLILMISDVTPRTGTSTPLLCKYFIYLH